MEKTLRQQDERTAQLLGEEAPAILAQKHVVVFGIGGVGSFAVEALARAGVGRLTLVDHDVVSESNINRQLVALHSTVGQYKTDVAAARISDINSAAKVRVMHTFLSPPDADSFDFSDVDFIVDAIDTVSTKIALVIAADRSHTPIISCMGAGNRLDPTRFVRTDLFKTSGDPLARIMRNKLRKAGITHLNVVTSTEPPATPKCPPPARENGRTPPGSLPYVPSVAGLIAAGAAVEALLCQAERKASEL